MGREEKLKYKYLESVGGLKEFIRKGGIITILVDGKSVIAFSACMLLESARYQCITLTLGLTFAIANSSCNEVMRLLSVAYLEYASEIAFQKEYRLNATCPLNCPRTFSAVEPIFNKNCYPFRGNSDATLKDSRELTFENYITPNFPEAKLFKGFPIFSSNKKEMGFIESYQFSKATGNSKYDGFIAKYIHDFSTQDLIISGDLFDEVISYLKFINIIKNIEHSCNQANNKGDKID